MNKRFILMSLGMILIVIAAIVFAARREGMIKSDMMVTATFYPLAEFTRQIGGDKVDVNNITPAGTEPHDFEPSPQEIVLIQMSRAFVYSGAGFEPWINKVLPGITGVTLINASYGMTLMPAGPLESANPSTAGGERPDPHYYLDPLLDQQVVKNIADGLGNTDPENRNYYEKNATELNQRLTDLNNLYRNSLSQCSRNQIVTSHAAFAYLAKRYGLEQMAISGISEEDPSPARLSEIAALVKANQVRYIFYESLTSPRLSQTIANETGAQTLVLNPIEGLTPDEQSAGKDFFDLMGENLSNLRLALDCK